MRCRLTENRESHHTSVPESNVSQMCAKTIYLVRALLLLRTTQITKSRTKYVIARTNSSWQRITYFQINPRTKNCW